MPSIGKQLMLEELLAALRSTGTVFFARYQGLAVSDFNGLRRKLEKVVDRSLVVKNTIARLAFREMGIKEVNGFIKGSVLLTLGGREPQVVSKVLFDLVKSNENFQVAGACLDGELYETDYLKSLAALPERSVLIASVVQGLNAPIGGFVGVIGQLIRSLAVALDQIGKKKIT